MTTWDDLTFESMLITDVFQSMKAAGKWFDLSKANHSGEPQIPYVARTGGRNGIGALLPVQAGRVPNEGNAITIGVSTSTVFYQPSPFYTSKEIQVLRHPRLNAVNAPILVSALRAQMGKFKWGNGASLDRLRATRIMIPVVKSDENVSVDWDSLDELGAEIVAEVRSKAEVPLTTDSTATAALPELTFAPRNVMATPGQDGIFRAHKGRRLTSADRRPGVVPFVGAARFNNSIVDFADVDKRFPAGWVTLVYNGDGGTGHAKYQPAPFNASDDVIVLEPLTDEATEASLLMLVTMLTQQCVSKFSFGYKLTLHRLSRQKIMVPVTTNADGDEVVDWAGMDQYGRALRSRAERQTRAGLIGGGSA